MALPRTLAIAAILASLLPATAEADSPFPNGNPGRYMNMAPMPVSEFQTTYSGPFGYAGLTQSTMITVEVPNALRLTKPQLNRSPSGNVGQTSPTGNSGHVNFFSQVYYGNTGSELLVDDSSGGTSSGSLNIIDANFYAILVPTITITFPSSGTVYINSLEAYEGFDWDNITLSPDLTISLPTDVFGLDDFTELLDLYGYYTLSEDEDYYLVSTPPVIDSALSSESSFAISSVPEPAAGALLSAGLSFLLFRRRRM